MRQSVIAGCVCVLGVWGCEDSELIFPSGATSSGVTGDAGRGGENATGGRGGTGGTTRSTTGDGGTGLDATTSSSTSSSNGTGGTGGAGSTSAGGTGGAGGSSTSSSSTTSTGWVPVGDGPACMTDADCASLQDPPFARCWTAEEPNGNNTCIECIPADHICSSPGNPHPWDCPLEFDNPNPGKCGLTEQTLTTLHYCCQDGA